MMDAKRILIADDKEENLYMLRVLLKGNGFEVETACDGAEALKKALDNPPDLIVTDILMPVMDGFSLCREWQKNARLKSIPFIFYTATYTDERDREFALSLGATRFIVKPEEPDTFILIISEVIEEMDRKSDVTSPSPDVDKAALPVDRTALDSDESAYLKTYNETLFRKLTDKMEELERDIEARKAVENRLRESEEHFASIIESSGDAIVACDDEMRVNLWNSAAERIFGYTASEMIGGDLRQIVPARFLDDKTSGWRRFQTTGDGKVVGRTVELKGVRKDGEELPIELTVSPRLVKGKWHATAILRDVSERKKMQERLFHAQKLEAIGQLAGGIAHDFNNLLTGILGYVELIQSGIEEGSEIEKDLNEIQKAAQRAADLVSRILSFSRQQQIVLQDIDLNNLIQKAVGLLRRVIGEHIELNCIYGHKLGIVEADPIQIEQILLNLATNARDAMSSGGRLTIETENVLVDEKYIESNPWAKSGRYILMSVSDTGTGMPAEVLTHVFEPFFTTKNPGEGTGLGLASVYGTVQKHGGMIYVYSEVGRGTTFKIFLPVITRSASIVGDKVQERIVGGSETLLLAEDDELVRNLVCNVLTKKGYTVISAKNGKEAVELYEKNSGIVALLILDMIMPQMGGIEAYTKMRENSPGSKVLFCTGYSTQAIPLNIENEPNIHLISKPYSSDALLKTVREIIDSV